MNILNKLYTLYGVTNHFRHYLFIFCALLSVVSFSSCSDTNWEQIDSEKVLLASSTSPSLDNSVQKNEFEKVLVDFLAIPSDNQLKEYIHPQLGFYINHKPGAISIVEHFKDLNEVYEHLPHLEPYFKKFNGKNPTNGEIPKFDCEVFSKEGTFYQVTSSFNEIEKGMEINEKIIEKNHSKEEKELAKQTDQKISRVVVLTDDYLEIGFTNIDGKWYMLWFNLAKFDCSA
ncbi:hypothetical protein Fleli_3940 [Bernardetia litoralis DSM 6794]|uniref:Uncharacterized protein n=1 Tax=Bernardetia litoralis (strain ATCC 23117 / DSM 6794 / NBRC 15988 / NCIMB 1366 / Fx l1 / Sio-4) TaxID=880071 RepID=I4AQK8_BERLS|nr:hypothetical protein [Bernardetia litoralis]AFM06243.1 hypothetical protein Fleli_3940 [Bernardetia litoralis DSM 6794]